MRNSSVFPFAWFAIRTKANREAVVTEALQGRGLEAWCPRFNAASGGRMANKPVFPGYLFCRFDYSNRLPVLTVPGLLNVVTNGKRPLPIDESEIASLRVVMQSILPVSPADYYHAGDRVKITHGPLSGAEGYIVERECDRLVVSITLLQRAVSVAVEREWLELTRLAA